MAHKTSRVYQLPETLAGDGSVLKPRPEFAQDILSGTLDLVCYAYPVSSPDIVVMPLVSIDLVVIARRNHPRIGTTLGVEELKNLGFVGPATDVRQLTMIDRDLLTHGIKRRFVYGVPRIWSIPPLVADSDLIAFMARPFAHYLATKFDLDVYEMPVSFPAQTIYMAWHIKLEDDAGHKWLREAMLAAAKDRLGVPPGDAKSNVTPFPHARNAGQRHDR